MQLMVSEIINKAATLPEDKAIEFLRANASVPLKDLLKFGLCKNVRILLPPGDPPYTPSEAHTDEGMFFSQARKLYLFIEGGNPGLHQMKRESIFIQMLEGVHPEDAKMLLLAKDKRIPLDPEMVAKAFPELYLVPARPFVKEDTQFAYAEVAEPSTTSKSTKKARKPKADVSEQASKPKTKKPRAPAKKAAAKK